MPCTHHLWDDPTGLCCTGELGHPGGHSYVDSHGSFVPDKRESRPTRNPRDREA